MVSIFAHINDEIFATYHVTLQFLDRVVGGTPSSKQLIEAWLRHKMGISREQELQQLTLQTLRELGLEPEVFATPDGQTPESISFTSLSQAAEVIAKKSNTTMFKRDSNGLYLEQRACKAMLNGPLAA